MDTRSGAESSGTLGDLIRTLADTDDEDELTIYVPEDQAVTLSTPAVLIDEEADAVPPGMRYLLEVEVAKEVLEIWSSWRGGRVPQPSEACEAVAYYADNDAYLPADH